MVETGTFDLALVGVGGAGLTQLLSLAKQISSTPGPERTTWRVALFDQLNRIERPVNDRTWCWWSQSPSVADDAVSHVWRSLRVWEPDGDEKKLPLGNLTYRLVRSADLARLVKQAIEACGSKLEIHWFGPALDVLPAGSKRALPVVQTETGEVQARWLLDSRPQARKPTKPKLGPRLVQHFYGAWVETEEQTWDPSCADLMDFRVDQPRNTMAFGYLLPVSSTRALIEYTEVSPAPLTLEQYRQRWEKFSRLALPSNHRSHVVELERGVIPLATHPNKQPPPATRILLTGTAGGAVRAATGYAFATMLEQANQVTDQLLSGEPLRLPAAHPRWHRWMDEVLLNGLEFGLVDGPRVLSQLFSRVPVEVILRVLSGRSTVREDVQFLGGAPVIAMTKAGLATLGRRTRILGRGADV